MAPLGPFPAGRDRVIATVGVSGGADSLALAILAAGWAAERGGRIEALIIDHALRPAAADEAAATHARLAARGIVSRIIRLDWPNGVAGVTAEAAREARLAALGWATVALGVTDLLLGHHAADQAETLLIRALAGSGPAGMAGMAAVAPLAHGPVGQVRVLRPLLAVAPARLRATLRAAGLDWVEDPTNKDLRLLRARLRHLRQDPDGDLPSTRALVASARANGEARAAAERSAAAALAAGARLYPEGYAVVDGKALPPDALGSLIGAIAGARPPSASATLATLAAAPRPCTLGGVRLMPAGRLGPGGGALLLVREARAMASLVAAVPGAVWDGRFVLGLGAAPPAGATFGPLGAVDAARLRRRPGLPISVLAASPAVRLGATLLAAPALGLVDHRLPIAFAPRRPAVSVFDLGVTTESDRFSSPAC